MKHRLYVDEVGNPGLTASLQHPNERFLSLTGVIIELDHVDSVVAPMLDGLKRQYFETHADEPLVLHRKEIVNRRRHGRISRGPRGSAPQGLVQPDLSR